jgi:hypothetical protein
MRLRDKAALTYFIEERLGSEGSPILASRMANSLAHELWDEIGYLTPTESQFDAALEAAVQGLDELRGLAAHIKAAGPGMYWPETPEESAEDWLSFTTQEQAESLIDAGVWNTAVARQVIARGINITALAERVEIASQVNSKGYWLCNGELNFEDCV